MLKRVSYGLFLSFLLVSFLSAQSTSATVSGSVVDPTGHPIQGADVHVLNVATGIAYTGKSNESGSYSVPFLQPGQYRVQVSKVGFKTLTTPQVTLNVQTALALNFSLPVGATSESVTVEAGSTLLNTTDGSVSTVIDRKFVANIPLNGRSFQDLISVTPGVVTQSPQSSSVLGLNGDFSVNGQRTESNYYTVDGVSANIGAGGGFGTGGTGNSGSLSATTALGTTQSMISVDALQEFRVQSSSYSAQYGRNPGGQFSLVTRSGTNDLHGSAFDYLRNNDFDANDWFNDYYGAPQPALRQNDFGATVGGPVVLPHLFDGRDRLFFFGSYEGLRLTQPQAAQVLYVPDESVRQGAPAALQPILNAFPVPNGPDFAGSGLAEYIEPFTVPSKIDSTSVRLDYAISPKESLFFRFGDTPTSTREKVTSVAINLSTVKMNTRTYTAGLTSQFPSRLTNDFRIGYAEADGVSTSLPPNAGNAVPTDLPQSMGVGSYASATAIFQIYVPSVGEAFLEAQNAANRIRQWNLTDTLNVLFRKHSLSFGWDYRRIVSPIIPGTPEIIGEFLSQASVLANSADDVIVQKIRPASPLVSEFAAFAQDEWRIRPSLSFSFGLRWEVNPAPTSTDGNDAYTLLGNINDPSSLTLAPKGTPLWRTGWYNFAPRLGVAWTAHDAPGWQTVLRTGGGVFFDTGNQLAGYGFDAVGFRSFADYAEQSLPVPAEELNFPISAAPPYTSTLIFAYPQHLQAPYTLEWNASLEQALSDHQSLSISYVGSDGRRLLQQQQLYLTPSNPNFGTVYYVPTGVTSNYQALQVKFQRAVGHGVQALAAYTWSHSIDFGSNNSALPLTRGDSDFDVRNNFQAGLSWDLPRISSEKLTRALFGGWGLDGRLMARTAFPVTLFGNYITDATTGSQYYGNVDLVPNEPTYLHGSQYPGGRALNPSAFAYPAGNDQGNAPRNFIRGFGETEVNTAARRDFHLHDDWFLQFRAEAFNVLNHPNFGYIDPVLGDSQFGLATAMLNQSLGTTAAQYQQGGPRSMQFALKLRF